MTKKEAKQCRLCRLPIDIGADNYCKLIDYYKGKFYCEEYYHLKCFNEKMRGTEESKALRKAAWSLLGRVNKLTGKGEEVYVT